MHRAVELDVAREVYAVVRELLFKSGDETGGDEHALKLARVRGSETHLQVRVALKRELPRRVKLRRAGLQVRLTELEVAALGRERERAGDGRAPARFRAGLAGELRVQTAARKLHVRAGETQIDRARRRACDRHSAPG